MKKFFIVLFFLFLVSSRYTFKDMRQYQSDVKTVEIKGEVNKPGVYEVELHATIEDVIAIAKGTTSHADLSSINQSLDIGNQSVIVIPKQVEEVLISINAASLEELDTLPGVGPFIAQRIVEYRNTTPFQKLEDIKNVKGIGDAMFEKIKGKICL